MSAAAPAFASVAAISGLSLVGGLALVLRPQTLRRGLLVLVAFAAGALLGDAFLHLIPEIAESPGGFSTGHSFALVGGVIGFFVLEKLLHWHHAHMPSQEVLHPVAITNLVGDCLHNFVDGALVAGSFLVSTPLGVATAIAVALHEIPQELGDFGILLHAGMKPRRALLWNFVSALTALAGAALALAASSAIEGIGTFVVAVTAGGFVYIASSDLIPELHKEPEAGKSLLQLVAILAGVGVMASLLWLE